MVMPKTAADATPFISIVVVAAVAAAVAAAWVLCCCNDLNIADKIAIQIKVPKIPKRICNEEKLEILEQSKCLFQYLNNSVLN